jgi:alpha-D-ribose 1-methylphosphonate 5-phosphate C-P lyase
MAEASVVAPPMAAGLAGYNYAFLDELSKKAIRRALLKAVAVPGYQVPFGSRELPIARGWGTGGLQITLSLIGRGDTLKVIDQGTDDGVNAVNIRRLVERTAPGVDTTTQTGAASIIQSRHRRPERPLRADQLLVLQVPGPEPLRIVERRESETRRMHGEADYSRMWVALYEDIVQNGRVTRYAGYPVLVNRRHIMAPTPIPRWDVPRLHMAPHLTLFGAGREKRSMPCHR